MASRDGGDGGAVRREPDALVVRGGGGASEPADRRGCGVPRVEAGTCEAGGPRMISRPSKVQNQPRSPRDHRQQRTGAAGLFGRLEEPYHGQPGETGRAVVPTGFSTPYPAAGLVTAQEDAGPNPPPFSAIVRRTKTPMTGRKDGRLFRCHRRTPAGGEIPAAGPFCMQSLGLKPGAPGFDFHRVVEKPASWPVCPGRMGGRGRASAIVPGSGSRSAPRRAASPGNVRRLDVEKRGGAEAPRCEKE